MYFILNVNIILLTISLFVTIEYCSCVPHLKRQFRAGWIASVSNIDWPSKPGLSIEQQKLEFRQLIKEAVDDKLNALIVQIRPTADSFYPSKFFPWSQWLTGEQGVDPGYDPLEFAINEAHNANLEFHAWFNPYRVSPQPDINKLTPEHIARKHPEWTIVYGDLIIFNPGISEAKDYVIGGVLEVVKNYDIDGIHFDDYFYPYPIQNKEFPDNRTFNEFGSKNFGTIEDWRRNNTNKLIMELGYKIKQIKPHVKFGISPFGVWRNMADDTTGSNTSAFVTCYDTLYADTRPWIQNCWIDYIVPQLYWPIGFNLAAYEVLVEWWNNEVQDSCVHLFVGHSVTNVGTNARVGWLDPHQIENQMILNLKYSNVKGSVFWNMQHMIMNKLGFKDILKKDIMSKPALIPQYSNDKENFSQFVTISNSSKRDANQNTLYWSIDLSDELNATSYFVIYRFDGNFNQSPDITTADNMIAIVKYNKTIVSQYFIDNNIQHINYTYYISAVTKYHNEGPIGLPFVI